MIRGAPTATVEGEADPIMGGGLVANGREEYSLFLSVDMSKDVSKELTVYRWPDGGCRKNFILVFSVQNWDLRTLRKLSI